MIAQGKFLPWDLECFISMMFLLISAEYDMNKEIC